jgi:hypothetical protein
MAQQTELRSIVDEEDEEDEFKEAPPAKKELDWDKICAYKTFKVVRIKDRHLGMLYWAIVTLVVLYIIIFALGIEGKHQYQEPGIGTVITRYHGKGFANGKAYDEADLRFPEVEPFGAFIMTKAVTVRNQKVSECVDFDNPCPCRKEATCVDGFCQDKAWCPSIGDGNADKAEGATVTEITGLEHTVLELMTGIAFPGIGNYFFVTGKSSGATNPFKNITLKDLLAQAQPPQKLDEIVATGALIGVSFFWNCDVLTTECEPSVVIKRLDNGNGFTQKRASHHTIGGNAARDAVLMYGIRILVDSSGIGRRMSFVLIVIQIGSGLALLRTASMASDFLMLKLYPKYRRDAYYKCKVIESPDYSDLQDRINLIQEAQQEATPLMKHARGGEGEEPPPGGATLGLGPGGRGGLASNVLRSR